MVGIRRKIFMGFALLALLLFFAGMFSFFELSSLSRTTQNLIEASGRNMQSAKLMLDAVNDQSVALLQMVALKKGTHTDSLFNSGRKSFDAALAGLNVTVRDLPDLDSIHLARQRYSRLVDTYLRGDTITDPEWFWNSYKIAYDDLTASVKNYLIVSQERLGEKATQLEGNAYRSATPSIISLAVAILLIAMFMYFIDLYFMRPLMDITRGLQNFLTSRVPFNVKMEGKDEVFRLRELIAEMVEALKKQNQANK